MLSHIYQVEMFAAALLLCVTNLLFTFLQRRTDKTQNRFYILMNVIVMLNAISQTVLAIAGDYRFEVSGAFTAMRVAQFSYFLLHTLLGPMFAFYVLYASGQQMQNSLPLQWQFAFGAPLAAAELMLLTTPLTGWMYHFDENLMFHRGWGEYLVYVCCALYFLFGFVIVVFSWKSLTWKKRAAMLYFLTLTAAGLLLQLLFIDLTVELFCEAMAMMGVMIAIEAEDDRIDNDTGFYNRRALVADLNANLTNRKRFSVICIKITNAEILLRATGSQNTNILSLILSDYLKSIVKRYYIYNVTSEAFILTMMGKNEAQSKVIAQQISKRFEQPFTFRETEIPLTAVVMAADVPARLHTAADVLAMADQPIPKQVKDKVLSGEALDYLLRRVAVEEAVSRGLKERCFEVYYQPTYNIDGTLHGAEALIRLHDPVIGSVFPDEFIPVAEQMGMIDDLDNFVFSEVCTFLKSGIPGKYGMDCINVNLSVMHCMKPEFVSQINAIAEHNGIDKSDINFEITESVAATDYSVLSAIVTGLKREGYHFSMDDYGTGYSNMESIFSLDFDVVKIDKSILWSAEKSEVGRIVLENTIHMVRQMHRKILVEGVETQSQIDLLGKLGVDYLQGFFFSRPIPKEAFVELIERQKKAALQAEKTVPAEAVPVPEDTVPEPAAECPQPEENVPPPDKPQPKRRKHRKKK